MEHGEIFKKKEVEVRVTMRILYLNTTYAGGGAEKVTRQIYDGMKSRGHEVYEIVCYDLAGAVKDPHVHVLYPDVPGKILQRIQTRNRDNESRTIPYALRYILRFIREHRIDVVHLNNPHDSFLGIRDIRRIREVCPMVWTLHDFWAMTGHCAVPFGCKGGWKEACRNCSHLEYYPRLRRDVSQKLYKYKKEMLTGMEIQFTTPSDWLASQVRQSFLRKEALEVVHNSLDTAQWKAWDKESLRKTYQLSTEKLILAFVAADLSTASKGIPYLVEALQKLDPEKYLLLIAGGCSRELREKLRNYEIREFGYIREQEKMNEFYALADVLVNPSLYETFGLVNLEAMASGTPVVCFDTCAMPEVVSDKGWLVEMENSGTLAKRLEELEQDRALLQEYSRACPDYVVENFEQRDMLDAYEKIYLKIKK